MASAIIQKLNQNEPNLETQNPLTNIASELLEKISHEGLGYMSKADLETFIFHLYMKNLEYPLSDYDLMSLFKISSSKLRALEMNRSIKYLQLDLNDKVNRRLLINFFANVVQKNAFEFPDDENGCVKFYIPDTHVYRIIEKYIVDKCSSPNYRSNPKQMEIKYSHLISLLEEIFSKQGGILEESDFKILLNESLRKDLKNYDKIRASSNSIGSMIKSFKENCKEEGFKYIAEKSISAAVGISKELMRIK